VLRAPKLSYGASVIFAIPVQQFVLGPEFARTIGSNLEDMTTNKNTQTPAAMEDPQPMISQPSAAAASSSSYSTIYGVTVYSVLFISEPVLVISKVKPFLTNIF
jgi:hypothetical protein